MEYGIKDLAILCDRRCADNKRLRVQLVHQNVFRLKAVSNIKRLLGPKPVESTMKEERSTILSLLDGCLTHILSTILKTLDFQVDHFSSLQQEISIGGF